MTGKTSFVTRLRRGVAVAGKFFMRILGPIMVCGANILICGIVYSFLWHVLPDLCGDNYISYSLNLIVGFYLLGNIVFNYIACINTSPGHPEPCRDPGLYLGGKNVINREGKRITRLNYKIELEPGVSYRWCRECNCIKPPRCHHDSITGKCVLDMDHFCPWMANCVGYGNYRYFLLFMIYLFIGCIYVITIDIMMFYNFNEKVGQGPAYYRNLHDAMVYSFTVCASAAIAVSILIVWHIYLCCTNQTTIEFYINIENRADAKEEGKEYKNPFDKGWRKNLKRVFGNERGFFGAILISSRPPPPQKYPLLPTTSGGNAV
jgi:palmitoyltransferase